MSTPQENKDGVVRFVTSKILPHRLKSDQDYVDFTLSTGERSAICLDIQSVTCVAERKKVRAGKIYGDSPIYDVYILGGVVTKEMAISFLKEVCELEGLTDDVEIIQPEV